MGFHICAITSSISTNTHLAIRRQTEYKCEDEGCTTFHKQCVKIKIQTYDYCRQTKFWEIGSKQNLSNGQMGYTSTRPK